MIKLIAIITSLKSKYSRNVRSLHGKFKTGSCQFYYWKSIMLRPCSTSCAPIRNFSFSLPIVPFKMCPSFIQKDSLLKDLYSLYTSQVFEYRRRECERWHIETHAANVRVKICRWIKRNVRERRDLTGPERVISLFRVFVIKLFCGTIILRVDTGSHWRMGTGGCCPCGAPTAGSSIKYYPLLNTTEPGRV